MLKIFGINEPMDVDTENLEKMKTEAVWSMVERWRFDLDDSPAIGPEGDEELQPARISHRNLPIFMYIDLKAKETQN